MNTEVLQMSADRDRRRTIRCACCGTEGQHRGYGWIIPCYARWVYHGRPEGGPPPVGATPRKPNAFRGRKRVDVCVRNHSREGLAPGAACPECATEHSRRHEVARRQARRAAFFDRHVGHDTGERSNGIVFCRTCRRGDISVDKDAVRRVLDGDPPGRLSVAERELVVVELRRRGLTYQEIGDRFGCSPGAAWRIASRVDARQENLQLIQRRDPDKPAPVPWDERHAGHDTIVRASGTRCCRSCWRGDYDVDEVAVQRAVDGDPPARLSIAERQLALLEMQRLGLTYDQIGARLRCTPEAAAVALARANANASASRSDTYDHVDVEAILMEIGSGLT
ncbi:hypothetical protein [Actinophytocola sp.]|uniref:hypothetical protein n=1 Tax=Actinophytocola sp. TaxID=1872138 RepID=UPI002ED1AB58